MSQSSDGPVLWYSDLRAAEVDAKWGIRGLFHHRDVNPFLRKSRKRNLEKVAEYHEYQSERRLAQNAAFHRPTTTGEIASLCEEVCEALMTIDEWVAFYVHPPPCKNFFLTQCLEPDRRLPLDVCHGLWTWAERLVDPKRIPIEPAADVTEGRAIEAVRQLRLTCRGKPSPPPASEGIKKTRACRKLDKSDQTSLVWLAKAIAAGKSNGDLQDVIHKEWNSKKYANASSMKNQLKTLTKAYRVARYSPARAKVIEELRTRYVKTLIDKAK